MPNILEKMSLDYKETSSGLNKILGLKKFPEITFDEAVGALVRNGNKNLVNFTEFGRDVSSEGEIKLAEIFNFKTPFWIRNYDRDTVPFYQKPDTGNSAKVINADLIFPPIIGGAFGGEIVGCGQWQDNTQEVANSLLRQSMKPESYEWYISLRNFPNYKTSSGFGLGIEGFMSNRFIALEHGIYHLRVIV